MTAVEPLRAVLLDLDGTLLDPGRQVFGAVTAATATLGPAITEPGAPAPLHRTTDTDKLRRTAPAEAYKRPGCHQPWQDFAHRSACAATASRPSLPIKDRVTQTGTKSGRADDPTRLRLQELP